MTWWEAIADMHTDWRRHRLARREIWFRAERAIIEVNGLANDWQRVYALRRAFADIGDIGGLTDEHRRELAARIEEIWKKRAT